tara:strand:- start:132 stop:920 length:789 start_codon:yes stop_codon:yes gene_type:complete
MSNLLNELQFKHLQAQPQELREKALIAMGEGSDDYVIAYNNMVSEVARLGKIEEALAIFESNDTKNMSKYLSKVPVEGADISYSPSDLKQATEESQSTEGALNKYFTESIVGGTHRNLIVPDIVSKRGGKWTWDTKESSKLLHEDNRYKSLEEWANIINVETGVDIEKYSNRKEYLKDIDVVMKGMKKNMPKSIYDSKYQIVYNTIAGIDRSSGADMDTWEPSSLATYFNLKSEDSDADKLLEGMFNDKDVLNAYKQLKGIE